MNSTNGRKTNFPAIDEIICNFSNPCFHSYTVGGAEYVTIFLSLRRFQACIKQRFITRKGCFCYTVEGAVMHLLKDYSIHRFKLNNNHYSEFDRAVFLVFVVPYALTFRWVKRKKTG